MLDDLGAHPGPGVAQRDEDAIAAGHLVGQPGAAGADIGCLDQQGAALRHRIARVDRDVQKRRLDLIHIDHDGPELGRKRMSDFDRGTNRATQHRVHLGDDRIQVRQHRIEMLLASEGKERLGQLGPARCAALCGLQQTPALLVRDPDLEQLQRARHGGQKIVEIMGDSARELTYSLHLLRLHQRRLRLFTRADLGAEPGVGRSQLARTLIHHELELLAAARQSIASLDDVLDVRAGTEPLDSPSCCVPDRRAAGLEPSIGAV